MATSPSDELLKHVVDKLDTLCAEVKEIKEYIGYPSTCSSIRKGAVSDTELGELASKISPKSMVEIAVKYLGFEGHELESEQMGAGDHQWKFNFKILTKWRNKCTQHDSRQALAKALHEAARSSGCVNYSNVQKILGIFEEPSNINQKEREAEIKIDPENALGIIRDVTKEENKLTDESELNIREEESELTEVLEDSKDITQEEPCETDSVHHVLRANAQKGNSKIYSHTRYGLTMNERDPHIISANDTRPTHASGSSEEKEPNLTHVTMLMLAKNITRWPQFRVLARKGLGVPDHRVEAFYCDHPGDIRGSAYQMLIDWLCTQPSKKQAYRSLCSALEQANMQSLIEKLNKMQPKYWQPVYRITFTAPNAMGSIRNRPSIPINS